MGTSPNRCSTWGDLISVPEDGCEVSGRKDELVIGGVRACWKFSTEVSSFKVQRSAGLSNEVPGKAWPRLDLKHSYRYIGNGAVRLGFLDGGIPPVCVCLRC